MTHNSCFTHLDAVDIPEVPALPSDSPVWNEMDDRTKELIAAVVDIAQKANCLATSYRELFLEVATLRADRDRLLGQLGGQSTTAH